MTKYIKKGSTYTIAKDEDLIVESHLPPDIYVVKLSMGGFYLELADRYTLPKKMYGNTIDHSNRIINTFMDRTKSTGVLLAGEKGSGKTLLAKTLSIKGIEMGIPTLLINEQYTGESFNTFLSSIDMDCIVIFDEFEKVYADRQDEILTLLDGVFVNKKLFIFTANNQYRISQYMRNRPGRLYYMIEYNGLDETFIREYCEDNLKNKNHINGVVQLAAMFEHVNFDMIQAVVEEMNRYGETAAQVIELLNAKPMIEHTGLRYSVNMFRKNEKVDVSNWNKELDFHPPSKRAFTIDLEYVDDEDEDDENPNNPGSVTFTTSDLSELRKDGVIVYESGEFKLVLEKVKAKTVDYTRIIDMV